MSCVACNSTHPNRNVKQRWFTVSVQRRTERMSLWWIGPPAESLTAVFVSVAADQPGPANVAVVCLDAARFGLAGADQPGATVAVESVDLAATGKVVAAGGSSGVFPASCVDIAVEVAVRSVAAVRLRLANETAKHERPGTEKRGIFKFNILA